jgi:hypothetical protein
VTVSFIAIGTEAVGTTSAAPSYPASISSGDLLLLTVVNKYPTNGPSTPSGWTLLRQDSGGNGSAGADSGDVYVTVFYKIADGTETGTLTVTVTGGNSTGAYITQYRKTGGTWQIAASGGSDNVTGTAWSVTTADNVNLAVDDFVIAFSGSNSDSGAYSTHAFSSTGITFSARTERIDVSNAQGDDNRLFAASATVTAGSGNNPVTYTATAGLSGANSQCGATVVVRLRQGTSTELVADTAAYTWSFTDTGFLYNRVLNADVVAYTWAFPAVDLLYNRVLNADTVAYSWSFTDTQFLIQYNLNADTAPYEWIFFDTEFLYNRVLEAELVAYTWNFPDAEIYKQYTLEAETAAYAWAFSEVEFLYHRVLDAETAAYTWAFFDAELVKVYYVEADTVSYEWQFTETAFNKLYTLNADTAAYNWVFPDITTLKAYLVDFDSIAYTWSFFDVVFSYLELPPYQSIEDNPPQGDPNISVGLRRYLNRNFNILRKVLESGEGVSGVFTTTDGKTVTVNNGVIVQIT